MPTNRRGAGPPRGPRVTKYAWIFWNDCKVPCGEVVNFKKISENSANLAIGSAVTVPLSDGTVRKGTVLALGKLFYRFLLGYFLLHTFFCKEP